MRPAAAPGLKATKINFRKSLLETPAIHERAKQLLLSHIEGSAWRAAPCSGKMSSAAILGLLRRALDAAKVPHCKPHGVAFTNYVIAHDSSHRRQIAIVARQRRECGFGK